MSWKSWPYWLKGGIICTLLSILGFIIYIITGLGNSCDELGCIAYGIFIPFFILLASWELFSGFGVSSNDSLISLANFNSFEIVIIILITEIVVGFIVGALIGLIYGKIKNRSQN